MLDDVFFLLWIEWNLRLLLLGYDNKGMFFFSTFSFYLEASWCWLIWNRLCTQPVNVNLFPMMVGKYQGLCTSSGCGLHFSPLNAHHKSTQGIRLHLSICHQAVMHHFHMVKDITISISGKVWLNMVFTLSELYPYRSTTLNIFGRILFPISAS